LAVEPAIDTFIERAPAILTVASHVHAPAVPPDDDHDVGRLPEPVSKDPLGATLGGEAGSSRNIKPESRSGEAYSTPFDCRLTTVPFESNASLKPSVVVREPWARRPEAERKSRAEAARRKFERRPEREEALSRGPVGSDPLRCLGTAPVVRMRSRSSMPRLSFVCDF
jgi:hypothetical protein